MGYLLLVPVSTNPRQEFYLLDLSLIRFSGLITASCFIAFLPNAYTRVPSR